MDEYNTKRTHIKIKDGKKSFLFVPFLFYLQKMKYGALILRICVGEYSCTKSQMENVCTHYERDAALFCPDFFRLAASPLVVSSILFYVFLCICAFVLFRELWLVRLCHPFDWIKLQRKQHIHFEDRLSISHVHCTLYNLKSSILSTKNR